MHLKGIVLMLNLKPTQWLLISAACTCAAALSSDVISAFATLGALSMAATAFYTFIDERLPTFSNYIVEFILRLPT